MGEDDQDVVLDPEQQQQGNQAEDQPQDEQVPGEEQPGGGEEQDEDVVQIGEEEPPASEEAKAADANWVNDLRRRYRELKRENAQLKATVPPAGHAGVQAPPKLPEKPKLADFDYDEEKFQEATDNWHAKKREVDAHEASQKAAADARQKAVQAVHESYAKSKQALKVKDYQDAEDEVVAAFDAVQQSIVMAGATNPAAVVYALGKTSKKLQELASIKDPVKFAVALGKLETEVKVTKRTSTKPAPETTVRAGSGSASATSDTLKRLEAEADRTGDRSKVVAWKRQQAAGK